MMAVETMNITNPMLQFIGDIADESAMETYVVGGYVRDRLLGLDVTDMDIVVVGDGVEFARKVGSRLGIETLVVHERFGTAMLPTRAGKIEFVAARTERYDRESRHPSVEQAGLHDDLLRRDFTVNAMAVCLNRDRRGELHDPLNGRADLSGRVLRTPLAPGKTFDDDPLRMLRAVRFASQLQFRIDDEAFNSIVAMKERLSIVSQERITEEFLKIMRSPRPSIGLRLMYDSGLMTLVFPEVAQMAGVDQRKDHHHKDVFLHTCIVVDNIAETTTDVWLRFAALVHDIAKPRTKAFKEDVGWTFHGHEEMGARMLKSIFRRMKLPMDPLPYVEKLVRLHLRPMALVDDIVTDSAVRRLVFDAGNDIDDLMKLCRADITSKNPRLVQKYLKNYDLVMVKIVEVEEKDRLRNWQPPLKGDEIMEICGIPPGKKVGIIKKAIEEAILDGRIQNNHESALQYLLSIKEQLLQN